MKEPRSKKRGRSRPIDGMSWVLRLEENEYGDEGYFCFVGPDGISVRKGLGGLVQRFPTEEEAQHCSKWLQRKFRIDKEHITPELVAHETTASVWLSNEQWADGLSLQKEEESRKRYLLVREDGEEFTMGDIDDNVADAIVRLFEKLNKRLHSGRSTTTGQ